MKSEDWGIEVIRHGNGYIITDQNGLIYLIQDDEQDELKSHEALLWQIAEFFSFLGCKHDEVRLRIVRERQDGSIVGDDGDDTRLN